MKTLLDQIMETLACGCTGEQPCAVGRGALRRGGPAALKRHWAVNQTQGTRALLERAADGVAVRLEGQQDDP